MKNRKNDFKNTVVRTVLKLINFNNMRTIFKLFTCILICFLSSSVNAQQLTPFYKNGKYGLKDSKGTVVMEPKYSECKVDGEVIRVEINLDWGLLDATTGNEIIPPTYISMNPYSEGLSWVQLDRKGGYINKRGQIVIPIVYEAYGSGNDFNEGIAIVAKNGKFGAIDLTGKEIIPFKYQSIGSFSEGMASTRLEDKFGFVNKIGKEIVSAKYDDVQRFEDGFAKVSLAGKWGTIDKTGKEIIAVKYDDIQDFNSGLASVGIGDNWGYVDTTGKEIIPLKFEETYWADDNTIHARKPDGTIIKFDKKGNELK